MLQYCRFLKHIALWKMFSETQEIVKETKTLCYLFFTLYVVLIGHHFLCWLLHCSLV